MRQKHHDLEAVPLSLALPLIEFVVSQTVRRLKMHRRRRWLHTNIAQHVARPIDGPELPNVAATTVNSIEEFLQLCDGLEESAPTAETVVYRGQNREFFLEPTRQISLLPCLARPSQKPTAHTWRMEQAYRKYLRAVAYRHISRLKQTTNEEFFFREMVKRYGMAWTPEGRFLADTPQGRFLLKLYPVLPNPWLLEAALQHYGFPTFALDATHSPLIALYFALHDFQRGARGALEPVPQNDKGVVYVLSVPKETPYGRGVVPWPRLAELYDMTLDNFSRPRRQFAVLLYEAGYFDVPDPPHTNVYSSFIRHIIRFSNEFWNTSSVREFIDVRLGSWLFPSIDVDMLYRKLRSTSRRWFPVYNAGAHGRLRFEDQFEFTRPRRIVLTGSDAGRVDAELFTTWHSRMGWIEQLPVEEVLRLASSSGGPEPLDIVVVCEPFLWQSEQLHDKIHAAGFGHGRLFVILSTGVVGDVQPSYRHLTTNIGGTIYATSNDPYDADYNLQNRLFQAQLELSRSRYRRRMKPGADNWKSFLDWALTGEAP
jgi:FRG domain